MLFENVSIAGLAHVDAPHVLTTQEINERLRPTLQRLRIRKDIVGDIAGVHARRLWGEGVQASDAATLAGRKALAAAGIDADRLGLLVNTSVSRDYLEPSTASIVSGNLKVAEQCMTFDLANACLAFINGMDVAARMIERGDIDYALVVDGETADEVYRRTIERMLDPDITASEMRAEVASLTLGCGAVAMVLAQRELVPDAPRYKGGVTRSATQWNHLCRGNIDRMVTDTKNLLREGIKLAQHTFVAARSAMGWVVDELDHFVIHQVSRAHTEAFVETFRIDPARVPTIFGEYGNIGPASVPIVLSKLSDAGKLKKGERIALMGIGSGLNCSMAEVVW
ncbi:3-oxoacyl-ACP synthase III [Xanthomonas massiliensis]|uniref:3-oxoacyl-ACP synthase III n=1 Tax=Xanthomonas massiliensis TaxID=1720302 RepID=UPI00082644CB|nr:3-oxoacyl-ACP synthase III [Xanthomonas massiliensis]